MSAHPYHLPHRARFAANTFVDSSLAPLARPQARHLELINATGALDNLKLRVEKDIVPMSVRRIHVWNRVTSSSICTTRAVNGTPLKGGASDGYPRVNILFIRSSTPDDPITAPTSAQTWLDDQQKTAGTILERSKTTECRAQDEIRFAHEIQFKLEGYVCFYSKSNSAQHWYIRTGSQATIIATTSEDHGTHTMCRPLVPRGQSTMLPTPARSERTNPS